MIRINLLPVKAARKKQRLQGQLTIAAATLLGTLALCALAYLQLNSWLETAREEVDSKRQEITRLNKVIGEVNEYKKRQDDLRGKLDILEKLEKSRRGPVLVLDELYKAMPDKVWLESFKETGGKASLAGFSVNEETVALFMRNLEASGQFANVTLKVMQQVARDGVRFHKFDLDCTLEGQPQIDFEPPAAKAAKGKPKAPRKS